MRSTYNTADLKLRERDALEEQTQGKASLSRLEDSYHQLISRGLLQLKDNETFTPNMLSQSLKPLEWTPRYLAIWKLWLRY